MLDTDLLASRFNNKFHIQGPSSLCSGCSGDSSMLLFSRSSFLVYSAALHWRALGIFHKTCPRRLGTWILSDSWQPCRGLSQINQIFCLKGRFATLALRLHSHLSIVCLYIFWAFCHTFLYSVFQEFWTFGVFVLAKKNYHLLQIHTLLHLFILLQSKFPWHIAINIFTYIYMYRSITGNGSLTLLYPGRKKKKPI